ncbi:MAG: RDD family protein [Acidobacteria bacterium]|nr:RDD family protein [Acidobacteriota bacterium]
MRFDEVELESLPETEDDASPTVAVIAAPNARAPIFKRLLALLTDLSLFAALALALYPLLPAALPWPSTVAMGAFIVVLSYYYFVGTWLLWGKTIGGAIFDVRVVSDEREAMPLRGATMRWAGLYASLLTGGIGFLFRLPDRLSRTRCVAT